MTSLIKKIIDEVYRHYLNYTLKKVTYTFSVEDLKSQHC
jgi:hypothetical protein